MNLANLKLRFLRSNGKQNRGKREGINMATKTKARPKEAEEKDRVEGQAAAKLSSIRVEWWLR